MSAIEIFLPDQQSTERFGEDVALALSRGDLVTLSGDLGAGKSSLARAIIRTIADDEQLDVPSPTFTLVQTYDELRLPVAHADLYRLSSGEELDELGLDEMLGDGVVLVEWPQRADGFLPAARFAMDLRHEGEGRQLRIETDDEAAFTRLLNSRAVRTFLEMNGRHQAKRRFLFGDASPRRYETVQSVHGHEILMIAPAMPYDPPLRDGKSYRQVAHLAENAQAFAAMDGLIGQHGFRVPEIRARDLDQGFLLLENFGTQGLLDEAGKPISERYETAGRLLAHMHVVDWPDKASLVGYEDHVVADFDRDAMMIEVELLGNWYAPRMTGRELNPKQKQDFTAAWDQIFTSLQTAEKSLLLRDYHSPNLFWFDEASGIDRIGLIDFQDAMIGPAAYDVASLAMDARVTIEPVLEASIVHAYCDERRKLGHPFDEASFRAAYAIMGAQRNSKILGIFVRLDQRDGKPHYLRHLPRIHDYLARTLRHPVLAPLREWYSANDLLPEDAK